VVAAQFIFELPAMQLPVIEPTAAQTLPDLDTPGLSGHKAESIYKIALP